MSISSGWVTNFRFLQKVRSHFFQLSRTGKFSLFLSWQRDVSVHICPLSFHSACAWYTSIKHKITWLSSTLNNVIRFKLLEMKILTCVVSVIFGQQKEKGRKKSSRLKSWIFVEALELGGVCHADSGFKTSPWNPDIFPAELFTFVMYNL